MGEYVYKLVMILDGLRREWFHPLCDLPSQSSALMINTAKRVLIHLSVLSFKILILTLISCGAHTVHIMFAMRCAANANFSFLRINIVPGSKVRLNIHTSTMHTVHVHGILSGSTHHMMIKLQERNQIYCKAVWSVVIRVSFLWHLDWI